MDIYREQLLEHYRHPHGWGLKKRADTQATGYNPLCGDAVTVQLDLEGNNIKVMRFEGHGCVISHAAASLLNMHLGGKTVEQVLAMGQKDIETLLGISLPPARVKCGLLTLETIQLACRQALDKLVQ